MTFDGVKDEELMRNIQQNVEPSGDGENSGFAEKSFKELYKRYYSQAYSFCRYYDLGHDDAVESIQDAFIKIFKYSSSFQTGKTFRPWFFRILYHKINDKHNELNRHRSEDIDNHSESLGEESGGIKSFHDRELLNGIIYKLPKYLRDCVLLYAYQSMDFREIGRTVGISPRHVRNRINEAFLEMKRMIGDKNEKE